MSTGKTRAEYGQTSSTLWGPYSLQLNPSTSPLEVSMHTLPKPLLREFHHVFPEENLTLPADETCEFLAIPTNQHAVEDLVAIGDKIEQEKDRCLNVFMEFANDFCRKLQQAGYWADFIDPCSGLPMLTLNCNKVYSEVDGMECCLGYRSYSAGFCKILEHPLWGSAVYPATMFVYAPRDVVQQLLERY
ncbi:hypothetical protein FisN_18Lh089 [Fistulifera solaris]|uniref:Methylmalonic aciduria and homocystinuria type D protein n=1 Tax=Fistulifera solaris TaxID=1519565 RepID=A0A1Z5KEC9_FISSO|nr:hypothetical protein FisN_18Lh089 [Fistulifera solaris]|eukprot:GAX24536.1 hypothetical protein FisN_18Lh089 [Fistulifera solaris]